MSAAGKHSQPYPWEQRKPKNYLRESRILGSTGVDAKKLTVKLWGKGVVEKKESISGSSNTRYYIRHAGQLMYGKLDFLHAAFGIVPKELDKYESTADSPAFDIIDGNPKFLLESFLRKEFYLRNGQRANGSRKAKRIHEKDFLEMPILVPYKNEQTKIGKLINSLDKTITLHEEKQRQLEQLKKALLQKMFADETGYPVLRFKGFTEKWEQVKLSKTSRSYSGGTPKVGVHEYYDGQIPFIRSGEIASKSTELTISKVGLNNSSAKLVSKGDILYALYGATSGEVSLSKINGAINQAILAIKPIDGYENYFLMTWLQKEKEQITRTYLQGGQGNLSAKIVMNLVVNIPSLSEQSQIAQIFSKLDKTITLHDKKIQYLKQLKRGLLQKMFI